MICTCSTVKLLEFDAVLFKWDLKVKEIEDCNYVHRQWPISDCGKFRLSSYMCTCKWSGNTDHGLYHDKIKMIKMNGVQLLDCPDFTILNPGQV